MSDLTPTPYQLTALSKLELVSLRGILLADGVGVGKTISAGYVAKWRIERTANNVLVICPPTLVDKWRMELSRRFDIPSFPIQSSEELETAISENNESPRQAVYILPYSRLTLDIDLPFSTVIIDEIHNFRNKDTQRWERGRALSERADWRVGLSATPINNGIQDLGSIYALLFPNHHPYAVSSVVEDIWESGRFDLLYGHLTRFTKEKLGIHFARRNVHQITVEFPLHYMEEARSKIVEASGRGHRSGSYPLETITYYRQAASSPAAISASLGTDLELDPDPKFEHLREIIGSVQSRLLIFTQFVETAQYLADGIDKRECFVITGEVPVFEREELIERFRSSEQGILILTSVGSEGLDFQFCNQVVNYDLHWNPMVLEQRVGRVDRVGQRKDEIFVYNFQVKGSIDERVSQIISEKLSDIIDTPLETQPLSEEERQSLYDPESIGAEEKEAERMAEGLSLSSKLELPDYQVVGLIDEESCHPSVLTRAEPLDWLRTTDSLMESWMTKIQSTSTQLRSRLDSYQELAT